MGTADQFTLKLAFKDSPGPTDDQVNLNATQFSTDNPAKYTGFVVAPDGFTMGPVQDDEDWGKVRLLTIKLAIEGSSRTDLHARLRNLNRFIQRSNFYFEDLGDNRTSRSDGRWHDGEATVVTYKPADALYEVCWDVLSGTPVDIPTMIDLSTRSFNSISFTLLVSAAARLTRVKLNNGVALGDASPPLNVSSTAYGGNFQAGYTFSGGAGAWQIIEDGGASGLVAKYGFRTLTAQLSGASLTTNAFEVSSGDIIVPDIWAAFGPTLPTGGTFTAKLQAFISGAWTDVQTFASVNSFTGLASPSFTSPNWIRYSGTAYTVSTATLVRLTITAPTLTGSFGGAMGLDGLAMWKRPVGNVVPVSEYATGGKTAGIPAFNLYGLRGDVKTPIKMRIDNTGSQVERFFVLSGMTQDLGSASNRVEYPLFGLDLASAQTGTAAANLPWGTLPSDNNGTSNPGATSTYSLDNSINRNLDRRAREYRAILWYAANDTAAITSVKISLAAASTNNVESKTFNVALPATYTGNTVPTAAQFLPFDLGILPFGRPGGAWEQNVQLVYNGLTNFITLTHANVSTRHTSIAGIMLLPVKPNVPMSAALDIGTQAFYPMAVEIYNEGDAPRVGIQVSPGSDIPIELTSYEPNAQFTGGDLWVLPAEASTPTMGMRFEILMFRDRSSTTQLFSFDARDTKQVSVEYTPLSLYGMAS
jgi:hypothetical protein